MCILVSQASDPHSRRKKKQFCMTFIWLCFDYLSQQNVLSTMKFILSSEQPVTLMQVKVWDMKTGIVTVPAVTQSTNQCVLSDVASFVRHYQNISTGQPCSHKVHHLKTTMHVHYGLQLHEHVKKFKILFI